MTGDYYYLLVLFDISLATLTVAADSKRSL